MKKQEIEQFLNKNCKIILKNNFNYYGKIISINDDGLIFEDRFDGEMLIKFHLIDFISNWNQENSFSKWKKEK